ncbi:MAG: glycosyltransferase family 2 protein [Candidatus Firestonebacteria bacterium]
MKTISIVNPCYNEESNVLEVYRRVKEVFAKLKDYDYEQIFIDNCSKDDTVKILREIAAQDKRIKVIVNSRNYGHIRSPFHGLLQAKGDAAILLVSDLQDPPEMIADFIAKWESGFKIVVGVKKQSGETKSMFFIRKAFYRFINKISEIELTENFTGFGLYDKRIIEVLRTIDDPYPYFRGLICDIGFERAEIEYFQPTRKRGITKNNFYTLYDMAMLGITNYSKLPLRIATIIGFILSVLSILVSFVYLILKLVFWQSIPFGFAPIIIGLFFFGSVQLFFTGILGEYIGSIYTQVLKRPLVIEKERINFDEAKVESNKG